MNWDLFTVQLRNELLKLFARKRTYLGFVVFLLTELVVLCLWQRPFLFKPIQSLLANNGLLLEDYNGGLSLACFILILTVGLVASLYLTLVGGDLVAKEMEEGTIRMVLARPVSRAQLFAIKALTGVVHTFILMLFIGLSSLLAGLLFQQGPGQLLVFAPLQKVFATYDAAEGLWRYLGAVVLMSLTYQAVSALALMCSCLRLRPATATVLSLSVLYVDFALTSIPFLATQKHWFFSHHLSCWVLTLRYFPPWHQIVTSLLILTGLTVSFWTIGLACFCARDIKN
jgi:ABC-2 type transport system permease protein